MISFWWNNNQQLGGMWNACRVSWESPFCFNIIASNCLLLTIFMFLFISLSKPNSNYLIISSSPAIPKPPPPKRTKNPSLSECCLEHGLLTRTHVAVATATTPILMEIWRSTMRATFPHLSPMGLPAETTRAPELCTGSKCKSPCKKIKQPSRWSYYKIESAFMARQF